ncbi:MAG: peptidoglycan-associated lipoprotein Pal [Candidatus Rokubacteria bacterium]|nr:peptidoglycan-associated lipoprotein Pal [Candidatus Rokubacteria bacterium]
MARQRYHLGTAFLLLVLALFLMGCPKRTPTVTLVAATPAPGPPAPAVALWTPPPPPVAPAEPVAPTEVVTPVAQTAPAPPPPPIPVAPPPPREFTALDELKDVHFDFDKYDIRPAAAEILDANAAWMKANPGYLILVEGHCDERGTNEYNLALGERRAKATLTYLLSRGLDANRFTLVSYGKERPVCTEQNPACWTQNRRAHFLVKGQ